MLHKFPFYLKSLFFLLFIFFIMKKTTMLRFSNLIIIKDITKLDLSDKLKLSDIRISWIRVPR